MAQKSCTPDSIEELVTPCFLVDLDVVKNNSQQMLTRCKELGVKLRPHMKTHKTLEAGQLMTGGTRRCITVSTLAEAEFFADGGFDDILYAFPFTRDKLPRLVALESRLEAFHVMVDSSYGIAALLDTPLKDDRKWSVFLKVNCGYNRAGVDWDSPDAVDLARRLFESKQTVFQGLYIHDGNSYSARGVTQLHAVGNESADKILQLAEKLRSEGIDFPTIATGSTPSCSQPGDVMAKVTEFHPGNYSFYDAMQEVIGSCKRQDIACRVATRIIGQYPQRNQLLVDCGFLALSHDGHGALNGSYCLIDQHPELKLTKMTQEIGFIEPAQGQRIDWKKLSIGAMLFLVPYHACDTSAMHPLYYIHSQGRVVDVWKPCRGW